MQTHLIIIKELLLTHLILKFKLFASSVYYGNSVLGENINNGFDPKQNSNLANLKMNYGKYRMAHTLSNKPGKKN